MFKMSNQQAMALNSPVMQNLLNDHSRCFPTDTAFKLADILHQLGPRIQTYQTSLKAIAVKHNGNIQPDGRVDFKNPSDGQNAAKEIEALASIELEYTGEKLTMTSDWPKLTVAEAMLLRPLINETNK